MDAWRPKHVKDLRQNKVIAKVKVYYVGYVIVINNDTRSKKSNKNQIWYWILKSVIANKMLP
jgi:hypothetical protein